MKAFKNYTKTIKDFFILQTFAVENKKSNSAIEKLLASDVDMTKKFKSFKDFCNSMLGEKRNVLDYFIQENISTEGFQKKLKLLMSALPSAPSIEFLDSLKITVHLMKNKHSPCTGKAVHNIKIVDGIVYCKQNQVHTMSDGMHSYFWGQQKSVEQIDYVCQAIGSYLEKNELQIKKPATTKILKTL